MFAGKKMILFISAVLAVSLFSSSLTAFLLSRSDEKAFFGGLGRVCRQVVEECPQAKGAVSAALKEYSAGPPALEEDFLLSYGYRRQDFTGGDRQRVRYVAVGFFVSGALFFFTFFYWRKKENARIRALTGYLERVNAGDTGLLLENDGDEASRLQDEIYKTVMQLYQTREEALRDRNLFAENLSNIAHQLKTPITSISLTLQMLKEKPVSAVREQIGRQLLRLEHLEEALLLLSRLDAGTLDFQKKETDVFTLLTLAADNLEEIFAQREVSVEIPEAEAVAICVDTEWTMEAVMNLMKNCAEHTPPRSVVHCAYEKNPLYTQIQIWDEGPGFAKADLPHLFERFYRGSDSKNDGIGIGLSLAKQIIEAQNGTLTAENLRSGARFTLRFYR